MRRSADAIKKPTYAEDKDSGELRRPHHLDLKTGMYKGRQVLKKKNPELDGSRAPRGADQRDMTGRTNSGAKIFLRLNSFRLVR